VLTAHLGVIIELRVNRGQGAERGWANAGREGKKIAAASAVGGTARQHIVR